MRLFLILALILAGGASALWVLSAPDPIAAADLPQHTADLANGKRVFDEAGCASCHVAPGAGEGQPVLAGGQTLATPLGPIVVPNISPDRERGIGGWSAAQFVSAVTRGVSPEGTFYVPAFPWTSYRSMTVIEALDLYGYLLTLAPSADDPPAAGLPFPFSFRRPIGLWKRFALGDPPPPPSDDAEVVRGQHLVVALGHCGECHTPRTALFAPDYSRWLQGAAALTENGKVPSLAPTEDGLGAWSTGDIAYLLESGFTPEFDSVGGEMAKVVRNWSKAPAEDRAAVAAYLKALPPPD